MKVIFGQVAGRGKVVLELISGQGERMKTLVKSCLRDLNNIRVTCGGKSSAAGPGRGRSKSEVHKLSKY